MEPHLSSKSLQTARSSSRESPAEKASPADAFAAARNVILAGTKLDMAALAIELGIGRATLYRWTGDREQLIKEVLALFLRETFAWIDKQLEKENVVGAERFARVVEHMMRTLTKSKPVYWLLRNEPEVALRILTGDGVNSLQGATIDKLVGLVEQEIAQGNYRPRLEPLLLAYATVRLVDSFVYGDIIAGVPVNLDAASKVIRSLL
jgi:AcrR family transcriptional regulator